MAFCKDKLVNYLESIGYNLVRLPRTGIAPLDIIIKDGDEFSDLGSLPKVWLTEQKPPKPEKDGVASNIQQKQTSLIDVSVGLKALSEIFSGMGFSVPGLNIAFSKAKKLIIRFNNVAVSKIEPFDIGNYLKSGDVNHLDVDNLFVQYFLDDEKPVYIISETLRSDSITIDAYKDTRTAADLDLGILKEAIKASTKISIEKESNSTITYTGSELLTFGFKCYQISYTEHGWGIQGNGKDVFLSLEPLPTVPEPVKFQQFMRVRLKD